MGSDWQAANLVASPSFPNSIAWSNENLVAVASGHIITILNPALLDGPRGTINLILNKPFPIGVVKREDLFSPCLMPICFSRETRPCSRSLAWSQPGFAPNSGSLLAVCTLDGRVKLYRPPFCDFGSEWIEVVDISNLLYAYYEKIDFGEQEVLSASSAAQANDFSMTGDGLQSPALNEVKVLRGAKRKVSYRKSEESECTKILGPEAVDDGNCVLVKSTTTCEIIAHEEVAIKPCSVFNQDCSYKVDNKKHPVSEKPSRRKKTATFTFITPQQYASRSALLSSTILAWSPVLESAGLGNKVSRRCTILAVGGKSGNISFWKIYEPQYYTIEHGSVSVDPIVIGLLQAHNSWITAISWGNQAINSLKPQLILATGSSDGSVKIWLGDVEVLIQSLDATRSSFSLLQEVTTAVFDPVSVVALLVTSQMQHKVSLAVGRNSGTIEAYICDLTCKEHLPAAVIDAHTQAVTGLVWAFDGCCLYCCSQDNSVNCWVLRRGHLQKLPFSSRFPGLVDSTNLSQVSDSCFGLASSPGNLMVAVVYSFDVNLLDQMYQARTQKAVVGFFWIGGQDLEVSLDTSSTVDSHCDLFERDLCCWESNMLWSLKNFDSLDKPLVLWEVLAALLAFKKESPLFVEKLLSRWISSWFPDSQSSDSLQKLLLHSQNMLRKISSRKIHLLNLICRRLSLSVETDKSNNHHDNLVGTKNNKDEALLWNKVVASNESELRQRLVAFTFRAVLSRAACDDISVDTNWSPLCVAQMDRWVSVDNVHNQLKVLASEIRQLGSRISSFCEIEREERCSFCSAPVQFESPEVAWCEGSGEDGSSRHKLQRCAVSMRLCSIISPMWFCICCRRWASNLAPRSFFEMPDSPLDLTCTDDNRVLGDGRLEPLCPFCGIRLQRSMPEFLLSTNPV